MNTIKISTDFIPPVEVVKRLVVVAHFLVADAHIEVETVYRWVEQTRHSQEDFFRFLVCLRYISISSSSSKSNKLQLNVYGVT